MHATYHCQQPPHTRAETRDAPAILALGSAATSIISRASPGSNSPRASSSLLPLRRPPSASASAGDGAGASFAGEYGSSAISALAHAHSFATTAGD